MSPVVVVVTGVTTGDGDGDLTTIGMGAGPSLLGPSVVLVVSDCTGSVTLPVVVALQNPHDLSHTFALPQVGQNNSVHPVL